MYSMSLHHKTAIQLQARGQHDFVFTNKNLDIYHNLPFGTLEIDNLKNIIRIIYKWQVQILPRYRRTQFIVKLLVKEWSKSQQISTSESTVLSFSSEVMFMVTEPLHTPQRNERLEMMLSLIPKPDLNASNRELFIKIA